MSIQPIGATSNIVATPPKPVSKDQLMQAVKDKQKAEEAKAKPREERTAEDKIAIAKDFLSNMPAPQVMHANSTGNSLNVLA